ncbi:MAG: terminase large subunit [Pirellulales bacterium]
MTANIPAMMADPAAFRRGLLIDTDTGPRPLADCLDPWQRDDFAALDPGWRRACGHNVGSVRQRGYLERPRGHSKTGDIAAMVTWALFASRRQLAGVAAAADSDQARLLRDAIGKLLKLNPWLTQFVEVQRDKIVNVHTGSTLTILSSDAASSYGLSPDFVVCDEVCHWGGRALWDSLLSSAAKRSHCMLVVISNAGFSGGHDPWQWQTRELVRTDPDWIFSRLEGPVASWISRKALTEQRRLLPPSAFDRLWLNKWSAGAGDAIPESDIRAAVTLEGPAEAAVPGVVYVAGLDLGLSRDSSSLVILSKESNGPRCRLAQVSAWTPTPGHRVSIESIESAIISAHQRFNIQSLFLDPWQASQLCERLRKAGVPAVESPFVPKALQAMATEVIQHFSERTLELYPCEPLLADLRSLRIVEKSYGFRLEAARNRGGHADRATALCLALLAAKEFKRNWLFRGDDEYAKLPTMKELFPDWPDDEEPERGWVRIGGGEVTPDKPVDPNAPRWWKGIFNKVQE